MLEQLEDLRAAQRQLGDLLRRQPGRDQRLLVWSARAGVSSAGRATITTR